MSDSSQSDWRQHFPTYLFKDRDIALEEYKAAARSLESEERVFMNVTNLAIVVAAALGSLALGTLSKLQTALAPIVPDIVTMLLVMLLTSTFATHSLRYFADRQKVVVFAARKVIVLRRMLGMSYGSLQLVLPNWRIEGADEPLAVRLFPGWTTYVSYPCIVIAGISATVTLFISVSILKQLAAMTIQLPLEPTALSMSISSAWFVAHAWSYRRALLDTHERPELLFALSLADALRVRITTNVEYVIYRATLAAYEMRRLGVNLRAPRQLLVHIEDKSFYKHSGVSIRGLARLLAYAVGKHRRTGGSTITQQLVRTLFIKDQHKLFRRKVIELLLARWFHRVVPKDDQLDLYLSSVRFEASTYGLVSAMRYYFGKVHSELEKSQMFFLIERISNIRSRLMVEKIDETLRGVVHAGLLTESEARDVVRIYDQAVQSGRIIDSHGTGITRLRRAWNVQ